MNFHLNDCLQDDFGIYRLLRRTDARISADIITGFCSASAFLVNKDYYLPYLFDAYCSFAVHAE